ncbi:Mu-like prophage FluMu protein gp28 [Rhodoferax sp. OV413]|uniref:terminase large subunit domain-containing protein n=1 Tax=Rhodoferax sp. OV413 TaxID=1855285 RepID=UPI0008916C07|nr:terminase family protein [Rhodoferax sp. OV413]SDO76684.1 Mu-like prophage FluMu protein gp28 [Rhodoferax sp. OV413]
MSEIITPEMQRLAEEVKYDFSGRAPSVLLGYQKRWIADESQVKVDEKSRRVGMSWTCACESVLIAAAASGRDQWYIGYTKDMAVEFILDAAQWAGQFQSVAEAIEASEEIWVEGDEKKSVFVFSIKFASGHRITALSSRPRNLRSKQGDVVLDEFAFHDDPAGLLKAALALLIWGGRLRILSTHFGDDNEFNTVIKDIRAGRKPYKLHRTTFDDALAEGLYVRVCLRLGIAYDKDNEKVWADDIRAFYGDDAEEELDCVPKNGAGSFLTRELIENCMVKGWAVLRDKREPDFTFKPERTRQLAILDWCEEFLKPELDALRELRDVISFVGGDVARIGDLSAFAPMIQFRSLVRRIPFLVELRGMPFTQQLQVLWYIMDHLPRFVGAALDSRGLGMQMAEQTAQRYGQSRILMIQATQKWYLENLPPYKAAFEDRLIQIPMDADVLADHRVPRIIKGIPLIPDVRTQDAQKLKRHGDTFIAGSLAWHASRTLEGCTVYDYQGAPPSVNAWDGMTSDDDNRYAGSGAW